jgi:hypothetical protein
MKLLKRLVTEIRGEHPAPFCLSVKLNSGDYMEKGDLSQDEALELSGYELEQGLRLMNLIDH